MSGSKRRYKITNSTLIYHEHFDRRRVNSSILNSSQVIDIHTVLMDKRNIQGLILERRGDSESRYNKPGERSRMAWLPGIEQELRELDEKYKQEFQKCINEGRPGLKAWPVHLQEQKHRLEAEFDVVSEELESLENALKTFTDQEDVRQNDLMLRYGPAGSSQLSGGFCASWDGMKVSPDASGLLYIDQPDAPYHGLSSVDYYSRVVLPWKRAIIRLENAKRKLAGELHANGRSEEIKKEWAELRVKLIEKNGWKDLFALKFKGKSIPAWPAECKNHLENKKPEIKRTKPREKIEVPIMRKTK